MEFDRTEPWLRVDLMAATSSGDGGKPGGALEPRFNLLDILPFFHDREMDAHQQVRADCKSA